MGGFRVAFRSGGGGEGVTIGGVRGSRVAFRGGGGCGKIYRMKGSRVAFHRRRGDVKIAERKEEYCTLPEGERRA
jgi:hypothetical protein